MYKQKLTSLKKDSELFFWFVIVTESIYFYEKRMIQFGILKML